MINSLNKSRSSKEHLIIHMRFALLVIIGLLLFNSNDARQFTAERLYDAAEFIDPEHKQNNSSTTSSTNITEATKQDWNDFWYNSESEGRESKPEHLSEYVDHLTKDTPYPPKYKRESPLSE